jgi:hypothetical protein
MLWIYEREQTRLLIVTRIDRLRGGYVLDMEWPDGRRVVERFATSSAMQQRLSALERSLDGEQWVRAAVAVMDDDPRATVFH